VRRAWWFLFTLPLLAEFRSIEMAVSGLDCASCAGSVAKRLRRIRGVGSAEFVLATSTAVVRLKPDNTVTPGVVRDALKGLGYTPGAAKVVGRGQAVQVDGSWRFRPSGSGEEYLLETPAGTTLREGVPLIVEGQIPAQASRTAPDILKASAVRAE
jgi:copper chaperone CopZ